VSSSLTEQFLNGADVAAVLQHPRLPQAGNVNLVNRDCLLTNYIITVM
jgi:hypothetical protein